MLTAPDGAQQADLQAAIPRTFLGNASTLRDCDLSCVWSRDEPLLRVAQERLPSYRLPFDELKLHSEPLGLPGPRGCRIVATDTGALSDPCSLARILAHPGTVGCTGP